MRRMLANRYLSGSGIEIGGLHYPLPVPPTCKVTYVDRVSMEELAKVHADVTSVNRDIVIDDAESLLKFKNGSLDFLIANHVLEHCQDVIMTLSVWMDRLKPGGIVYCALPEKTQTFDRNRPVTQIDHLAKDFAEGPRVSQADHYREYFSIVDGNQGQALEDRIALAMKENTNIHFHVWDLAAQSEMFFALSERLGFAILAGVPNGAEVIWILRKSA